MYKEKINESRGLKNMGQLNKWIGMGRLTAKPELKTTPGGKSVVTFTLAVDRNYKSQNGEQEADFPQLVAWDKTAEFISRYFDKGSLISIVGAIQTRSYVAQDGSKRFVTEVKVDEAYFTGERKETSTPPAASQTPPVKYQTAQPVAQQQEWEEITNDDELPFD